jgi:hypothetical protein
MHAGHWIVRQKKYSRWDEHNVHAQCPGCNTFYNGEPQAYEDRIVDLYGEEERDRLKRNANKIVKFTTAQLEEMYNEYKQKVTELREQRSLQ